MTTKTNTQNNSNHLENKAFLDSIGDYKTLILTNIASHYGITIKEAYEEVTYDNAWNILEYMNGTESRVIALLLWNKFNK
jgi:hypothetical protein